MPFQCYLYEATLQEKELKLFIPIFNRHIDARVVASIGTFEKNGYTKYLGSKSTSFSDNLLIINGLSITVTRYQIQYICHINLDYVISDYQYLHIYLVLITKKYNIILSPVAL